MGKLIWVCAALMAVFVTGESLTCNTCRVGLAGKCLFGSSMTCSDSQPNCYWGKLAFNISRLMSLETQGCLASSLCNQTESGALLTAGYTVTRTCCSIDRCNGATSIQLPLTAALGAAILAIWSTRGI
ncbi:sperm acrosome membrane-associated protein 4-like [Morone saxatilis]|uniref:sperm acrosome membrane-associated protein 4-like n=1 Tax=Morone saxatilis TaxID=34816 RepID=UPI0015E1FB83|nr:sperm acrosome membrane-associated protein 4-like [Morone saxatilis]